MRCRAVLDRQAAVQQLVGLEIFAARGRVGVVILGDSLQMISDPFLLSILGSVADTLDERGMSLLLTRMNEERKHELAETVQSGRVGGLIVIGQLTWHEHLNRLAAQTRESFSAVVLDVDEVVIVARSASVGGQRLMAYGLHLGARLPVHATSTGWVLLAALPRAEFSAWLKGRELARLTPHTTTDATAFKALVVVSLCLLTF